MATDIRRIPAAVLELTVAERARTVLSSADVLLWNHQDEPVAGAFVEEVGSPTLVLSRTVGADLLGAASGQLQTYPHPSLGTLQLCGDFWPLTDDASLAMLSTMWCRHAECGVACRNRLCRLVGMRVDRAQIWLPEEQRVRELDPEHYQLAKPSEILAAGVKLAAHLNADHQTELRQAAGGSSGLRRAGVLSAQIDWIDADGFDLSVIDADGGRQWRHPFGVPPETAEELSATMHRSLSVLTQ